MRDSRAQWDADRGPTCLVMIPDGRPEFPPRDCGKLDGLDGVSRTIMITNAPGQVVHL